MDVIFAIDFGSSDSDLRVGHWEANSRFLALELAPLLKISRGRLIKCADTDGTGAEH